MEWKSQSFSSVGAQHQNARAEVVIQTIMNSMARTQTERGSDDLSLWSFTVKLLEWVYNQVPNVRLGLTPLELITRECSDYKDILRFHVWGCPVFVLKAKLQNDQKRPKWNRRDQMGQFIGFPDKHSSLVANVRHLTTKFISPPSFISFSMIYLKQ
jgi:hypothetical protein